MIIGSFQKGSGAIIYAAAYYEFFFFGPIVSGRGSWLKWVAQIFTLTVIWLPYDYKKHNQTSPFFADTGGIVALFSDGIIPL